MIARPDEAAGTTRTGRRRRPSISWPVVVALALAAIPGAFALTHRVAIGNSLRYARVLVASSRPMRAFHEIDVSGTTAGRPIPFLPAGGSQPKIVVLQPFHDFGPVGYGEALRHTFLIINDGPAPLTISRAYTTCGCTTARISASIIPAGEAARVTITFDPGMHMDAAGTTIRRALIVGNNDPLNSRIEIWIQAEVRAEP